MLTDLLGATPELAIMASVIDEVRPFLDDPEGTFDFADAITLARGLVAIAQDAAGPSPALTLADQILNAAGDVSRFEGQPPATVMVVTLIGLIKETTGPNPALDAAQTLILLLTDPIGFTRDGVLEVVNLVPDIFGLPAFLRSILDLVLPPPGQQIDFPFCPKLDYAFATLPTQLTLNQSEQYEFDPIPRVKLVFPVPVQFTVTPCDWANPLNTLDPENPVVCSGNSNVIIYDAGSSVSFPYPEDLHTMRVTPTFMLPNQFSNSTITSFNGSFQFDSGRMVLVIDPVDIIPEIVLIPRLCLDIPLIGEVCTPSLVFPALGTPELRFGQETPLFSAGDSFSLTDDSMFDQNRQPWVLGGFRPFIGESFSLDAEVQPTAVLEGPETLLEGEEGIFSADKTVEIDIGENLFYDWDFDDGITAQGRNFGSDIQVRGSQFPHAYADNGPFVATGDPDNAAYRVSLTADDEHEQTNTALHCHSGERGTDDSSAIGQDGRRREYHQPGLRFLGHQPNTEPQG